MFWEAHVRGVELDEGVRDHIERRLTFALSRFEVRLLKVTVHLTDNNGPKGGIDKSCLIVARLRGVEDVVVEVIDSDCVVAIDRATSRIGHTIGRALERRRDFTREPVQG